MILNPGGKVLPNLDALTFGEQTSLPAEGRTDPAYYEAIADAIAQRTAEGGITLVPLSVTANGSYTPESGQAYSGVTVAVPSGGGGNLEILVTAPTGSVVTASKDGSTYTGVEDSQNPGSYTVSVPEFGTYTVTAVWQSVSAQAEVSFEEQKSVTLITPPLEDYTPLEYISNGTPSWQPGSGASMATGVAPNGTALKVEIDFATNGSSFNNAVLCGVYNPNSVLQRYYLFSANYNVSYLAIGYGAGYNTDINRNFLLDGVRRTFTGILTDGEQSISFSTGESYTMNLENGFPNSNGYGLDLFGANSNGSHQNIYPCTMYSAKIWLDGQMVRYFLPYLQKSTGLAGMYDVINGGFYTSLASGKPFIAGPEVS